MLYKNIWNMVNQFGTKYWQKEVYSHTCKGKKLLFQGFSTGVLGFLGSQQVGFWIVYISIRLFSCCVCVFSLTVVLKLHIFMEFITPKPLWTSGTKFACVKNYFINFRVIVSSITSQWNGLQNITSLMFPAHSQNVPLVSIR